MGHEAEPAASAGGRAGFGAEHQQTIQPVEAGQALRAIGDLEGEPSAAQDQLIHLLGGTVAEGKGLGGAGFEEEAAVELHQIGDGQMHLTPEPTLVGQQGEGAPARRREDVSGDGHGGGVERHLKPVGGDGEPAQAGEAEIGLELKGRLLIHGQTRVIRAGEQLQGTSAMAEGGGDAGEAEVHGHLIHGDGQPGLVATKAVDLLTAAEAELTGEAADASHGEGAGTHQHRHVGTGLGDVEGHGAGADGDGALNGTA